MSNQPMSNPRSGAILRIASRGSPLALAQARLVRETLARAHSWDLAELDTLCPIVAVKTTGDKIQDRPLADAGGKGLFTKEIEEALLAGNADLAVHSMKDVPSFLPEGLEIAAVLERADPRDVFIARGGAPFAALKMGARVGTSSVRRAAQMLRTRPDVETVPLRGNVGTRLAKLAAGEIDAILLAQAGLARLGERPKGEILDGPDWLPAPCQGAIGIEFLSSNAVARGAIAKLNDWEVGDALAYIRRQETSLAIACERAFLATLDGSCRTPIAGLARAKGATIFFEGEVLTLDGRKSWRVSRADDNIDREAAAALGRDAAEEIRATAGAELPRP